MHASRTLGRYPPVPQGWAGMSWKELKGRSVWEPVTATVVGDSGRLWIQRPETDADSEFLQALVEYEIARRTKPVVAHGAEVPRL
jgi:hypothetical protein